ncbi:unnamed protein product, partial [Musa hybrid cultivar]
MGFWFLNSALTQMRDWMVVPPPLPPPSPPPRTRYYNFTKFLFFLLQIFSMHDEGRHLSKTEVPFPDFFSCAFTQELTLRVQVACWT